MTRMAAVRSAAKEVCAQPEFVWIDRHKIKVVFVSALPPSASVAARQMCRRIKARHPDLALVVGIWSHRANLAELRDRLALPAPAEVVTSLADALAQLEKQLGVDPLTVSSSAAAVHSR